MRDQSLSFYYLSVSSASIQELCFGNWNEGFKELSNYICQVFFLNERFPPLFTPHHPILARLNDSTAKTVENGEKMRMTELE